MNVMNNLCVILTDKGREKIILERKKQFGSQMSTSLDTGIPQMNISRWERGAGNPKFYLFRSYLQKLRIYEGFLKNKEYVSGTKYQGFEIRKIKPTKLNLEKAYILGVIGPGDGYVSGNYSIGLSAIDKDFVDYFQFCLEKTFGLKCRRYIKLVKPTKLVRVCSKQYSTLLCSKSAVGSLKKYNVSFKEKIWRIPEIIQTATKGYKVMYLKGIFDSQGSVCINGKFICIEIQNKEGIKQIKTLLEDLGVISSMHKSETRLQISSQKYLKLYNSKIGFIIARKIESLKKILDNYKQEHPSHRDVREAIPKMIELRKNGLSYRKIASIIGIGRGAVGNNLQKEGY